MLTRIDVCWSAARGLILSDVIRGNDFQARHTLLALKAGEPYRVARALGGGGGKLRAREAGARAADRAAPREPATEIGKRIDHPHAIGFTLSVAGIAAYLEGRWRIARDLTQPAGVLLRERCRGVAWEIDNTHYYSLLVLFYLGEMKQLEEALPGLLKEAEDRGDLFCVTNMRTRLSYLVRLAKDEPEAARQELREAIAIWPGDNFLAPTLVRNDGTGGVPALRGRRIGRLSSDRRALAAAATLVSVAGAVRPHPLALLPRARGDRGASRAVADRAGARVGREGRPPHRTRANALGERAGELLRAGIASVRRRAAPLERSSRVGGAGVPPSTWRFTPRSPDAAAASCSAARRARRSSPRRMPGWPAQGIRNPARMAAMLAPGSWAWQTERSAQAVDEEQLGSAR